MSSSHRMCEVENGEATLRCRFFTEKQPLSAAQKAGSHASISAGTNTNRCMLCTSGALTNECKCESCSGQGFIENHVLSLGLPIQYATMR